MQWSHRPTWPSPPSSHATDRVVIYKGLSAGRVIQKQWGDRAGHWDWSAHWVNGVGSQPVNDRGTCETLGEALDAVRDSYLKVLALRPDLDDKMREVMERTRRPDKKPVIWDFDKD